VKDWFIWYSKKFNVPCIGVESFCGLDHVTRDHVKAVSLQMAKLVPKLEDISETKFNTEHFQKTIDLSRRCSILWRQVLESAANRPSPFTFFDGTVHMGPAVVERGTDAAIKYYEYLLTELKLRTTAGISAVENEKYRIYWEGMPIWGRLRKMAELFISLNACVAASTYCNSWIFSSLDPQEPFDSMARAYTELFIVRSDQAKERYIEKMVKQYKIDGIIFHESKTCPNNSNSRYGMHRRLAKALNIPTVVIYGDQNDLRLFSEEQSITKIEAFMEQIRENHK
ncbi:MAG TPA: 2-hydroxyacyl-CoA dehydratase, partial [Desulfobacteraceae bacterium]|nr:2-hydroxyacyl-CoA dehydratase [Desulfobacteraceae bacterium]